MLMVGVIPRWIYKAAVRTLQLVLAAALFPVLRGCYLRVRHFGMTALASFGIRIEPSRRNTVPGLSPKSTVVRGRNQATRRPTSPPRLDHKVLTVLRNCSFSSTDWAAPPTTFLPRTQPHPTRWNRCAGARPACNTLVRSFDACLTVRGESRTRSARLLLSIAHPEEDQSRWKFLRGICEVRAALLDEVRKQSRV